MVCIPSRTALVLGVDGQDGSYLAERLLARGCNVIGVGRRDRAHWPLEGLQYLHCDISDSDAVAALLRTTRPQIVYHLAAIHGPAGFSYESVWRQVHSVNTLSVHSILEHARLENPACGLVYASTAKVFGPEMPANIDEETPRRSTCIYTTSKNTACDLIDYYRTCHGLVASVLYLFNHESPRRPAEFFVPRVAHALARALAGEPPTPFHSLDFGCDWGDAMEYMDIAIDIAERGLGQDFVIATGKTWTGREMVRQFFARHGLDYATHISETNPASGSPAMYRANTSHLKAHIGRTPNRSILDVCEDILLASR